MDNYTLTIAPRSQLFQLLALGFSHPVEAFHRVLVEGGYDQALLSAASGTGSSWAAPARPTPEFTAFEADYIHLFQVGKGGKPFVALNAGDHMEIGGEQGRPEFLLQYSDWYRHFGLKINDGADANELPDHLVCQLEFMAWLAHLEDQATDDSDTQLGYRRAQRDFLGRHLLPFLEVLVAGLQQRESQPGISKFYLSLAAATLEAMEPVQDRLTAELVASDATVSDKPERIDAVNLWG